MSSTTVSGVQAFTDYGSTVSSNSTATHHLTLYRAPSGALVFGAGTVQWAWGLDNTNAWNAGSTDPGHFPPDPTMEQFTINLLSEMGAQPESLAWDSSPRRPPPTPHRRPPLSPRRRPGKRSRTAAGDDRRHRQRRRRRHRGRRGSVDRQRSQLASGDAEHRSGTDRGLVLHVGRARLPRHDHQIPRGGRQRERRDPLGGSSRERLLPCSIWGNAITPTTPDAGDTHSIELGMKFTTETFRLVTGVRFYKSGENPRGPYRQPVEVERPAPGFGDFSGETDSAGSRRASRRP